MTDGSIDIKTQPEMIDFELQSVYGGWGVIRTPDDVDFTLRTGDETYEIWESITELLELYARLRLEESGGVQLGSGAYGEVDVHENHFSLETHGTVVEGSVEEAREAVERLLVDAFSQKDANGERNRRRGKLNSIERHLERKGIECDVSAVYEELLGE